MTLDDVLQRLYDSEINVSISSFWDSGWEVKLGDESNGYVAESNFHPLNAGSPVEAVRTHLSLGDAARWLDEQARLHFPNSKYADCSA